MSEKPSQGFPLAETENPKQATTSESMSFTERYTAIGTDTSTTTAQKLAALAAISEKDWISTHNPPLFAAALSLDPPEVKLAQMETALRAGADPNEVDHDLRNLYHHGRPLACCVNARLHRNANDGSLEGMVNNLPAIELLLRHGADPRLGGFGSLAHSALVCVRYGRETPLEPGEGTGPFYEAAATMIEEAARGLDEQDAKEKEAEDNQQRNSGIGAYVNHLKFWKS